jgi:hypothetical protein
MRRISMTWAAALATVLTLLSPTAGLAQERQPITPGPDRASGEGEGPFERLIIRGATLIDGTGAPGRGPMDIVIEGNRIVEIENLGAPGAPIDPERRPQDATREIDAHGMYVLPGLVDLHAHIGGNSQGTPAEYVYKLWMAHGVTTIRDPGSGNGVEWTLNERQRSAANAIVAPRIFVYVRPGMGWDDGPIDTPDAAREWVRWAANEGVDGLKLGSHDPEIMAALIDEARRRGLGTQAHLGQMGVARMDVLDAARLGLGSMEHWYGLPEALFDDRTVQAFPFDYNYNNEYHRFGQAGRLWRQAAPRGSEKWNAVIDELIGLGFVIDPTMTIYEASRDVMRAREAEWHETYTLPSLWEFYQPSRVEAQLPHLDGLRQRLQEPGRARVYRLGLRVHLQAVRVWIRPGAGTAPGGGIPSARGDPVGHPVGCPDVARAQGEVPRVRRHPDRHARRPGCAGGEPGAQPQGVVRHGYAAAGSRDRRGRARGRRQVHHQGRHRVRRDAAAGRRGRYGRAGEAGGDDGAVIAARSIRPAERSTPRSL